MNNLNPYNFFREFVISHCVSHGIPSLEMEPPEDSGIEEGQSSGKVKPMGSDDGEDWSTFKGEGAVDFYFIYACLVFCSDLFVAFGHFYYDTIKLLFWCLVA